METLPSAPPHWSLLPVAGSHTFELSEDCRAPLDDVRLPRAIQGSHTGTTLSLVGFETSSDHVGASPTIPVTRMGRVSDKLTTAQFNPCDPMQRPASIDVAPPLP